MNEMASKNLHGEIKCWAESYPLGHAASSRCIGLPLDGRTARRAGLTGSSPWWDFSGPALCRDNDDPAVSAYVSIAQPFAIAFGSAFGAAIGTVLSLFLGFGPGIAIVAAITALIALPLLRAYHRPGVALAMYPPLLHPGLWFGSPFRLCCHSRGSR
jgi:hypothetical protein